MEVTNTLDYYDTAAITGVKRIMVQTPELFQMAALWPVLKKYYNHCK
jgi:hypothetical protein